MNVYRILFNAFKSLIGYKSHFFLTDKSSRVSAAAYVNFDKLHF